MGYRKIYNELIHETHSGTRCKLAFDMGWTIEEDGEEMPCIETLESLLTDYEISEIYEGIEYCQLDKLIKQKRNK